MALVLPSIQVPSSARTLQRAGLSASDSWQLEDRRRSAMHITSARAANPSLPGQEEDPPRRPRYNAT